MSVTVVEFLAYPFGDSFAEADSTKLQGLLDFVDRNYCQGKVWRDNPTSRKDAIALIAAHFGYLQWFAESDLANAAIALRENGGSRSGSQVIEDWFKLTVYGAQYLDLRTQVRNITPPIIHTGFAF